MLYFVKIDLQSINKNPRAGKTVTVIPTTKRITFRASGDFEALKRLNDEDDIFVTESTYEHVGIGAGIVNMQGDLQNEEAFEKIKKCAKFAELGFEQGVQKIHHSPEPEWLYNYEDMRIECSNCGKESLISELESDANRTDEDEFYSDKICPHCGEWDCCELEHERIEDALARLEELKPPKQ